MISIRMPAKPIQPAMLLSSSLPPYGTSDIVLSEITPLSPPSASFCTPPCAVAYRRVGLSGAASRLGFPDVLLLPSLRSSGPALRDHCDVALREPGRFAFGSWLWPLLGLLFAPWTTLMYLLSWSVGGVSGGEWIIVGLGVALDLMTSRPNPSKQIRNSLS